VHNVTKATVRKWQQREDPQDRSHRPHKLWTTLSAAQESVVGILRRTLLVPLDDLLVVVRESIHPLASRSGLLRCLNRNGVRQLRELQRLTNGETEPVVKTFKSYEPSFLHVDIKYLPQMPDDQALR